MNCSDCAEWKKQKARDDAFTTTLIDELAAFSKRLRCEALTGRGTRCTIHPWAVRDGRPVCTRHRRAKEVRFA